MSPADRFDRAPRASSSVVAPPRLRWPSSSPTSSTRNWLTRLDLPEPETPVTLVNTPSGTSASSRSQIVARDAAQARASRRRVRGVRRGLVAASPNR